MDEVISFNDDVQAVSEMCFRNVKRYHEQPFKYTPDKEGLERFMKNTEQYFAFIRQANEQTTDGKPIFADVESWCTSLGITRTTLHRYYWNRSKEWQSYIDFIKDVILSAKKNYMMNGRISPLVGIFDLTNNHGYYSTNEFKRPQQASDRPILKRVTIEEIRENYESLMRGERKQYDGIMLNDLPKLAEELKQNTTD